jgi:hypothetical protein
MAKRTRSRHFYELAKRGAELRVKFLAEELKLLLSAFPHLKDAFDPDELPIPFIVRVGAGRPARGPAASRKPMSDRRRKAIGVRMRKYWAARKAAEK